MGRMPFGVFCETVYSGFACIDDAGHIVCLAFKYCKTAHSMQPDMMQFLYGPLCI